jgi:hypothetical protein
VFDISTQLELPLTAIDAAPIRAVQQEKELMPRKGRSRSLVALVALAAAALLLFVAAAADAQVGNSSNAANRGVRTMSVPPTTRTAPKALTQSDRPATQSSQTSGIGRVTGISTNNVVSRPGLLGGVFAGFLGAGLFGLLAGNGIGGGLAGGASIIGLLLQIALVILVARLVWVWWQRRHAPAIAGMSPRELADAYGRPRSDGAPRAPDPSAPADADAKSASGDQRRP